MSGITGRLVRRVQRLASAGWRNGAYRSPSRAIVIGGCPRSGTTMLRRALGAHPAIACGPETGIFLPGRPSPERLARGYDLNVSEVRALLEASRNQAAFIDAFFGRYLQQTGKQRWAEKTPQNLRQLDWIWRHFPEARFIHLIRDGRDTVCSMRVHPERRVVDGAFVTVRAEVPIEECIDRWVHDVRLGIGYRGNPRYHELRYEQLVEEPRAQLSRLFTFLGEPFDERVLAYRREKPHVATPRPSVPDDTASTSIHARSVGRWRTDLRPEEQRLFKERAGRLLIELGYAASDDW